LLKFRNICFKNEIDEIKIEKLEYYITQFPEFVPDNFQDYQNDLKSQMAVERLFQI
jgi:hypothetical protein